MLYLLNSELLNMWLITFAYGIFLFLTIQDVDMTAAISNRSDRLQFKRGLSHTFPAHTQHDRYLFMRHLQLVA